jgi:hypothetical protein
LPALLLAAPLLGAGLTRQLNYAALHRGAGSILHGRCVAKQEVRNAEAVPYIEYTFKVLEALKGCRDEAGKPLAAITLRHAADRPGYTRPDGVEVAPLRLGVPQYEVGQELVLFLTRESALKLCAPVGLEQGAFKVLRRGRIPFVQNGVRNQWLFDQVPDSLFKDIPEGRLAQAREQGDSLELERFLELCRSINE